jgi:hypothetical protein
MNICKVQNFALPMHSFKNGNMYSFPYLKRVSIIQFSIEAVHPNLTIEKMEAADFFMSSKKVTLSEYAALIKSNISSSAKALLLTAVAASYSSSSFYHQLSPPLF